ncbi:DUF397 domain-containing protein [Catellatospora citrea]|uniref:DUF397 domain-containing protein n=1 Tax=Catellatospora citrea TaxID=53366 RepID=UPI0033FB8370
MNTRRDPCYRVSNVETQVSWQRSTRCNDAACVEVAQFGSEIGLRDAKDPQGPVLRVTRQGFAAFIAGIRAGDFIAD